jgi:hypothetical protein
MAAYLGTYVSRVDDGGLEFRGDKGTLKIDRARLVFYRDDGPYAPGRRPTRRSSSGRAETGRSRTCRTGSTAFAAAKRRTPISGSRVRRLERRNSATRPSAPAVRCAGTRRQRRSNDLSQRLRDHPSLGEPAGADDCQRNAARQQ